MSRVSLFALMTALVALPVAAHAERTNGSYVGAGIGVDLTPEAAVHIAPTDNHVDYVPGYTVEGSYGYAYSNGLRAEAEIGHSRVGVDKIKGGSGTSGVLDNTNFFVNGLYDFQNHSIFTPYLGVGVGAQVIEAGSIGALSNGKKLDDTTVKLAAQGIAGLSAQIDDTWAVTADYRFIQSFDPKFDTTAGGKARTDNVSHNILVGLRYSFDTAPAVPMVAAAKPVAPTYVPSVAPKVAAAKPERVLINKFTVFFDFNKSSLTPDALKTLADAATAFQKTNYARLTLVGHADTVGGDVANLHLSERRTAAVKAKLLKLGVPAASFDASSVGKKQLRVPTADNVKEQQNRAVDIEFAK